MFRSISLASVLFFVGCSMAAAANCLYGGRADFGPGSLTCQLGEVRECNAGTWTVPASGSRRCENQENQAGSTLRIEEARAALFVPGAPEKIDSVEQRADIFAPICDGKLECSFVPADHFGRGGHTFFLYVSYLCVNNAGHTVASPPEKQYSATQTVRLSCGDTN